MDAINIDPQLLTVGGLFVAAIALLWFGKIVAKTAAIVIGVCLGLAAVALLGWLVYSGQITLPFDLAGLGDLLPGG